LNRRLLYSIVLLDYCKEYLTAIKFKAPLFTQTDYSEHFDMWIIFPHTSYKLTKAVGFFLSHVVFFNENGDDWCRR